MSDHLITPNWIHGGTKADLSTAHLVSPMQKFFRSAAKPSQSQTSGSIASKPFLYVSSVPLADSYDGPRPDGIVLADVLHAQILQPSDVIKHRFSLFTSPRLRLAWRIFTERRSYKAVVTSGEDVGYVVSLLLRLIGSSLPLFICFHGHGTGSKKNAALLRAAVKQRNVHWLCLSKSIRTKLLDELGIAPERCHLTYFGVDSDFFVPQPSSTEVLVVSAGMANRDYPTLVEAIPPGVPLRIAADSTWFPQAVNLDPAGVPSNVTVSTAGNYEGLRDLYRRANFVVVPLHQARYACGYAVMAEAMAMGKAVIATRTAQPFDLLVDGVTGLSVEPGDAGALRKAIDFLLSNPGRTNEMGQAGRRMIVEHASNAAFAERVATIVRSA